MHIWKAADASTLRGLRVDVHLAGQNVLARIASTVNRGSLSAAAIVAFVATIRREYFLRGIELAKVLWASVRFRWRFQVSA